ncbi:MAG: lipoyl synthase [Actinomycetota bacterium]|nr:lipoyl synthase [Actinomycetota bacterium]MDD5666757.1 lipoyl synthase [Actinomycetota bacterium]
MEKGHEPEERRERHYDERMPRWLHRPVRAGRNLHEVDGILRGLSLHTVCESAKCPNRMECYSNRTATFMLLGEVCSRDCAFCSVAKGVPHEVDAEEPGRVAAAAERMELEHVVMTSVTRDDLPDGGAAHFAAVIREVKRRLPGATVEVLTPDFQGDEEALRAVLDAEPDVFNHNLETVEELYPGVRPRADYHRSLGLLRAAGEIAPHVGKKSGLMVGLGETRPQLRRLFRDLAEAGCDMLTIGQYLRPSREQLRVERFLTPHEFEELAGEAEEAGIPVVASAPFVRSSYRARELLHKQEIQWAAASATGLIKEEERYADHR